MNEADAKILRVLKVLEDEYDLLPEETGKLSIHHTRFGLDTGLYFDQIRNILTKLQHEEVILNFDIVDDYQ